MKLSFKNIIVTFLIILIILLLMIAMIEYNPTNRFGSSIFYFGTSIFWEFIIGSVLFIALHLFLVNHFEKLWMKKNIVKFSILIFTIISNFFFAIVWYITFGLYFGMGGQNFLPEMYSAIHLPFILFVGTSYGFYLYYSFSGDKTKATKDITRTSLIIIGFFLLDFFIGRSLFLISDSELSNMALSKSYYTFRHSIAIFINRHTTLISMTISIIACQYFNKKMRIYLSNKSS